MEGRAIILNSPGPVADAFLQDDSFVSICIGPVGSAKTLTGLQKGLRLGAMQHGRVDKNGVNWRRARFGVLRESYPNIEKNILPSWFRLVAESQGKFSWKAPFSHRFRKVLRRDGDGKPIDILDMEYEFQAIGDKSVEEIMRGWEVNGFLVDEADLQPEEIIAFGAGRVGRFSDLDPKLVVNPQIVLTSNMPWTDNWLYKLGVENRLGDAFGEDLIAALKGRKLVSCFIQPGGRDPQAENLHNLPDGYYTIQAALLKHRPGHVERMIDNKPVPPQHGQPVHPEFRHHLHVSKETIPWDRDRLLIVSMDQGLFAAATFKQFTRHGQSRTLAEVVFAKKDGKSLEKIGPTAFGKAVNQLLQDRFPDIRPSMVRFVADPAAFAADDRADQEHDWVLAVQKQLPRGSRIRKAKSNSPTLRQDAVNMRLLQVDGFLIDPSCTMLIGALLGGYHYAKDTTGENETKGHLEIANTIYTHIADANQYGEMEADNTVSQIRGRPDRKARSATRIDSDYAVLGEAA